MFTDESVENPFLIF